MISIIIPLYNKATSIKRTIHSVLSQSYTDFELIIINDGSTDNSAEIVNKQFYDKRIRYIYQDNAGVSSARNRGIKEAIGEWILFLDADDILYPNALKILISILVFNTNIISGNFYSTDGNNKKTGVKLCKEGIIQNNYFSYYWKLFSIRAGCALINKNLLIKYQFDESLSRFEDLKFIVDILQEAKIYNTKHYVLEYRQENSCAKHPSLNTTKDYTFNMNFCKYPFWGKCLLGDLLFLASFDFPKETQKLQRQYGFYYIYRYISAFLIRTQHIISNLK